jgi:hypothetical protein
LAKKKRLEAENWRLKKLYVNAQMRIYRQTEKAKYWALINNKTLSGAK